LQKSDLIKQGDYELMKKWLQSENNPLVITLVYKGSRDGFSCDNFFNKV